MITSNGMRVGCFLLLFWLASSEIVLVNEASGINSPNCLPLLGNDEQNRTACKSLGFVASKIGSGCVGLTIVIENNLLLNCLVKFNNCSSLTITSEDGAVISSNRTAGMPCGLSFHNITNLTLSGITVMQCDYYLISMNRSIAVHVNQTTGLTIRFFSVSQTSGTGLVISDTGGLVVVEKSNFTNNTISMKDISTNNVFAGGIHMWFSRAAVQADIMVTRCTFENNHQPHRIPIDPRRFHNLQTLYGYGTGGGMGILFTNDSKGVSISLESCTFANNKAYLGAGLYVHFQDNSTNNSLTMANSEFVNNSASAGGGICVGIGRLRGENEVSFSNTTFSANEARYGGGTSLFGIHSTDFTQSSREMVFFFNCTWEKNIAYYSSAIDLSAFLHDHFNFGFLPVPIFSHCKFNSNQLCHTRNSTKYRNSGVFAITSFEVHFKGTNYFMDNKYTSLQLTSATVILEKGTVMIFHNNEGTRGGAIAMYGFSSLKGNDNCAVVFHNNSASKVGGALYYQPFDQREIIGGQSCFIQYIGDTTNSSERNYTFTFSNNTAVLGGTSMFAVSFYSCFYHYYGSVDKNKLSSFFNQIGVFQFDDDLDGSIRTLATEGNLFVLEEHFKTSFSTIPGEVLFIPLSVRDEFNHTTQTPIGLEINPLNETNHQSDNSFYYFTHNRTRVYGRPNDVKKLIFDTQNTRYAYYDEITVTLTDCPPGYYFDADKHTCKCSADSKYYRYHGIAKCNSSEFRAYIVRENWAGYYDGNLYTGPCAFELCHINSETAHHHLLPVSKEEMNYMMCGDSKSGILCGICIDNFSAYFHSNTHKCGPEDKCDYGIIFYFLSELVPTVILFTLIIHLDISFTSGGVSGFIFFSQMVLTIPTDMEKILYMHKNATVEFFKSIQLGYTLIYNILNLSFFSIDKFSFCLWHRANPMDILVFSYVTTSTALFLVWFLVRIMNSKWYMRRKKNNKPRSVVHGLSAFLVLSFSQCTKISFDILSQNVIQSNHQVKKRHITVTHHGGFLYFESDHLPYAITAIFFLVCIGLIPLLLLLIYPLLLHILSLCKVSEHRITRSILKALHIHRLAPLFDSFQSCYKDRLRFFAGLYFLYKICILFCRTYTNNLIELMTILEAAIFIILGIHATFQPYNERSHNVVDSCLFFNLGLINGINMYTNYLALHQDFGTSQTDTITVLCTLQMALIYVPIIGVFFWCIRKMVKKRQHNQYQRLEGFPNMPEVEDRNELTGSHT